MVYNVSTYVNKKLKKNTFVVENNGRVLADKVFSFVGENIKDNIFNCVYRGLKAVSLKLNHEDVLIITVQNYHAMEWLNGLVEHKGYTDWLDKVFDVLEKLDCRYRFVYSPEPFAKNYSKGKKKTAMSVSSLDDMMSDFE